MTDLEAHHSWQLHKEMPFNLRASMGHVSNGTPVFVYGNNPDVQAAEETIWYGGGIYQYPASAIQMKVSSDDAAATSQIIINGLDANYNPITEMISVTGRTPVTTVKSYLRLQNAYVIANPTNDNIYIGDGTVTAGVPATVYERIYNGHNRTESGRYTVPAGRTFYISHGTISHGSDSSNAFMTGRLIYRLHGLPFQSAAIVNLNNKFIDFWFDYPIALPERSDIETRAFCSKSQANAVSTSIEGILITETQPV
jgi:hypothetical protein